MSYNRDLRVNVHGLHCKNWDNSPQDLHTMTLAKAKVWGNAAKCFSSVFSWDYFFFSSCGTSLFFLFLIWRKVSQLAILIWLGNIFMSILGEAHPQYVENNLNKKSGLGKDLWLQMDGKTMKCSFSQLTSGSFTLAFLNQ